jgi:uncharacterized membrane protein (GlpM family)
MSTQRIFHLLISILVVTAIAFASERSRVWASIFSVVPLNITIGLWFVFTGTDGNAALTSDFARMVLWGLIPTALFVLACWFGLRQGWPLWRALAAGYAVWLIAMAFIRITERQVHSG